ncbi:MAG: 4Fe-4S dicluster domain-containing protein [Burkholderiaceae bacterium]
MRIFSNRHRPFHLGGIPMERLARTSVPPPLDAIPTMTAVDFEAADPASLNHAMARYLSMFDVVRDGPVNPVRGEIPDDPAERARHLKSAAFYFDATLAGVCRLPAAARLAEPVRNPRVPDLAAELERGQIKTFAAGMDMIYADVLDSARATLGPIDGHDHALVVAVEHWRAPRPGEAGCEWLHGTQQQRATMLAALTAVLISSYLRMLGFSARSHTGTCSDVDLNRLAVAAGLAQWREGQGLVNPYLGTGFGLAAVTTNLTMATDAPLAGQASAAADWRWRMGLGTGRGASGRDPYTRRDYVQGAWPFESLKRVDTPTTFIDHDRVPRFPKRADFFARVLCGDMGRKVQDEARNAHYVMKSPIGACARRALGALLLLQFGEARGPKAPGTDDPARNAANLKAASYYLSCDAVGLCAIPEWAYYSHDAGGNPMPAYHPNAVNLLLDQGQETMAGCSGDDWISVAQSMRAYLRFSLLGGVLGEQIRRLGYGARVHTVLDGDVLQPPLLLLSGLGEVSRIGEVILNPFLGPRLKSGTVSTDMPMTFDRPIDFGLQRFCEGCNKCARECPSGAITAGPKLMYNGYEIWKSDAEKCARYRITNQGGGMCGRCMKTCPWNLEGVLADAGFRALAMSHPERAPLLARLDDALDRGDINPTKKWWWDIELDRASGGYVKARTTHARGLNKNLTLRYEDQTLAVYPADRMPPPFPVAFPVDREEGIARYRSLLTPAEYRRRLAAGDTADLVPRFEMPTGEPPVFPVTLVRREEMAAGVARYEFAAVDGGELPAFEPGAHIEVVIAPEYLRQYSLAGDPADRSRYVLGVLREPRGRGGSMLMHRAFRPGKRVFVSKPVNHFPLQDLGGRVLLFAGGIGVTPLLTMAHALHRLGRPFALHYSIASRADAGFLADLATAPWAHAVHLHVKDEGGRARLADLIPAHATGDSLYTCGSARYMDSVFDEARAKGWPDEAMHREYFSVPEDPDRVDQPFTLRLTRRGLDLAVPAGQSATDVLESAGIAVDVKCSDGICGVCAASYDAQASSPIEHRDHVLSARERASRVILCSSRCAQAGGTMVVDL